MWPSCVRVLEHAACACLQGHLGEAEQRLQGMAAEQASLEAQLRAAQLQASSAIQVHSQTPSTLELLL